MLESLLRDPDQAWTVTHQTSPLPREKLAKLNKNLEARDTTVLTGSH